MGGGGPNYGAYGSTGGTTAAPAAGGGGMSSGMMAGVGGAAMIGGALLDYYGQTQGAKAAEREAKRQAAEQAAMLEARHASYMQALGRADPAQGGAVAGQQANLRMNAAAPTLAAGGKALGLNSGQVASVGRALLPAQIAGGQQGAQDIMQQRRADNATQLSNEQGDIDTAMQGAAALYPMRDEIAKMKGAEYRTGGQMLGAAGMPLIVAGMNRVGGEVATPTGGPPSRAGTAATTSAGDYAVARVPTPTVTTPAEAQQAVLGTGPWSQPRPMPAGTYTGKGPPPGWALFNPARRY